MNKGNNSAPKIELTSITVDGGENNRRDNWWEHNVSEQFPIKSVKETDGSVDIKVNKPHEGCIIKTTLKNSKMNGESRILSSNNVLMATLTFVDGIASGPCTIYDNGHLLLQGTFVNGYLEGKAKEYDTKGQLVSEWFYEKGKKLNIIQVKEMGAGYWKECDDNGNIIRISQKDDSGNNNGLCYSYSNGKISRVSLWKEGKEVELLKQFSGNTMIEYKNGHKVYEGEYLDSIKEGYPRNGKGIEFDEDGKTIFQGNYKKNTRCDKDDELNTGIARKEREEIGEYSKAGFWICQAVVLIVSIFVIYISFVVYSLMGTIILTLMLILLLIRRHFYDRLKNKGLILIRLDEIANHIIQRHLNSCDEKKSCKSKVKRLCRCLLENVNQIILAVMVITYLCFLVYSLFLRTPFVVGFFNESYIVRSNFGNSYYLVFKISHYPYLQRIEIGSESLVTVNTFTINKLNRLKTLKIGDYSFYQEDNDYSYNKEDHSRSFHILNCKSLESIEIGQYSFRKYGEFELKNLPQLQTIQIGKLANFSAHDTESRNFYSSSFVIRGIEMMLNA